MGEESTAEWELKARLADFTTGFRSLTAALDPQAGWYAAFARRAGEELNEWLAGRMLPPWDAVADLLQDLAALRGRAAAERTGWRLRERYEAATLALDTLPGARETLTRRLAELEHAEREAGDRERWLAAEEDAIRRGGHFEDAERLSPLRLWARDDAERLQARRGELRARLASLRPAAAPRQSSEPAEERPEQPHRAGPRALKGARFAGLEPEAAAGGDAPARPALPEAAATAPPRGARFAGAPSAADPQRPSARPTEEDSRAAAGTAEHLRALRAQGHSGAAHALLSEAASGPPRRLAALVAELDRAGMAADAATLLWEAASLPAEPLAEAARSLVAAERHGECERLLRQGAARPPAEAGGIAAELWSAGQVNEALTLLAALVEARTAEEAARAAEHDPAVVAPLLLDAARRVSPRHHYAIGSELRRAGRFDGPAGGTASDTR